MNQPTEPNSTRRLRGVIEAARVAHRFCDQKIGWGRIGVVLSIAIIAIAAYVLYNILRGIDLKEVLQALVTTDPRNIMFAALLVAGGYFTLTFYDLFALRTIGRDDVPYRIAALAGFTSYSVGHNVGASVFTGGAVRYRIYSAWGLDAIEVAKVCFIAGLTFWLGNVTVLGLGIAYVPEAASAINQLPAWFNRLLAIAALIVLSALCRLGLDRAACRRSRRLAGCAPRRAADAAADRNRDRRSLVLRVRDVHADAGRAAYRLCHARRGLRVGDAARLRQPCARRHRRLRRRHAGRALAI